MDIKEIYKKIIELSSQIFNNDEEQHKIDNKIERLIEEVNIKLRSLTDEEKDRLLLPFLNDFHRFKYRTYILRTLENVSTFNINNFLLGEILLENDVSGVIPYLRIVSLSTGKDIIKNQINDIYISNKVIPETKEFNNLCVLLFYIGIRQDVANKMKQDINKLGPNSKKFITHILENYKS